MKEKLPHGLSAGFEAASGDSNWKRIKKSLIEGNRLQRLG